MKIHNNTLASQTFERISRIILAEDFPWFYHNTTYNDDRDSSLFGYSFYHIAYNNNAFTSAHGPMLELAILNMLDKAGEKLDKLLRIRLGMITITPNTVFHPPHVDYDFAHKTGLFYINTADGNTTIFNEQFDRSLASNSFDQFKLVQDKLTIKKIITPKENTVAIFDGLHYHQSSTPTTVPRRIVINFNYTTKE
jgi:hypothetical protein